MVACGARDGIPPPQLGRLINYLNATVAIIL